MVSPGSELIIDKLKSFFDANASAFGADMVFLYGSLAGGNPRQDSDVDLAILFSPDTVGKDEVFDRVAELSARLSHLLAAIFFRFTEVEQDEFAKLAAQRNRLAHRYLNYRWEAIKAYKAAAPLIRRLLAAAIDRELKRNNRPIS